MLTPRRSTIQTLGSNRLLNAAGEFARPSSRERVSTRGDSGNSVLVPVYSLPTDNMEHQACIVRSRQLT